MVLSEMEDKNKIRVIFDTDCLNRLYYDLKNGPKSTNLIIFKNCECSPKNFFYHLIIYPPLLFSAKGPLTSR